jgi:hypothetical protein
MAGSLESASHKDAVGPPFEGFERVQDVEFAGTGQLHDFDVGRVRKAHRACQVSGSVGTVMTGKGQDLGVEVSHRKLLVHFRFEIHILTPRTKQFGVFYLNELPFAASEELALVQTYLLQDGSIGLGGDIFLMGKDIVRVFRPSSK